MNIPIDPNMKRLDAMMRESSSRTAWLGSVCLEKFVFIMLKCRTIEIETRGPKLPLARFV